LTDTEKAYEALEAMLVIGQLAPGSLHTERELGEMLELGRTPVREALQKLAHEGLVEIQSRRGIFVPPVSAEDQQKLLRVRRAVEGLCVEAACENATAEQRQALAALAASLPEAAQNVGNRTDFLASLRAAHVALTEAAENPFLVRAMRPVQGLSRRFWFFHATFEDYQKAAALHAAVLAAVSRGDKAAAGAASHALVDYLEEFTQATRGLRPAAG
jgi:DNA-binding GntR family transcriptional regulator